MRRLTHIIKTYSIFDNSTKAVELCTNRYEEDTKLAFNELWEKVVGGELTVDQVADRLVSKVFNNQRSIFELPNFASVSNAFAKSLAKTPGEEIILKNPYIPSEDLFNQEAELHSARISSWLPSISFIVPDIWNKVLGCGKSGE